MSDAFDKYMRHRYNIFDSNDYNNKLLNEKEKIIKAKDMEIKKIKEENKTLKHFYNKHQTLESELESKKNNFQKELDKIKLDIQIEINNYNELCSENNKLKNLKIKEIEDLNNNFIKLKDESNKELIAIKDVIDGIYKQELYEDEYNLPESKYIIKEPMIHLDVDKILEDIKNNCCEIKNINENDLIYKFYSSIIKDHSKCTKCFQEYAGSGEYGPYYRGCISIPSFDTWGCENINTTIKCNFPIEYKLNDDEYIINIYMLNYNIPDKNWINAYQQIAKAISIVYITNYGRIFKSNDLIIKPGILQHNNRNNNYDNHTYKFEYKDIDGLIIYNNNKTKFYSTGELDRYGHPREFLRLTIGGDQNKINLIEQSKLNYRMPKLFIDVIDAFHTQNTDLMQECCKTYLEISRESKVKESIMLDIKIKNISDEKDKIIEQKDKIIQDKDIEIESIKKQLEELQQKYDKIKSMFN